MLGWLEIAIGGRLMKPVPRCMRLLGPTSCKYLSHCRAATKRLTKRENGSFATSKSVVFWYLLISRNATVPGL